MNFNVNSTQQGTNGSATISGTGVDGTNLTVVSNGTQIGSGSVGSDGSFQINLPAGSPTNVTIKGGGKKLDVNLQTGVVSTPQD